MVFSEGKIESPQTKCLTCGNISPNTLQLPCLSLTSVCRLPVNISVFSPGKETPGSDIVASCNSTPDKARNSKACGRGYLELGKDLKELGPGVKRGVGQVQFLDAGTGGGNFAWRSGVRKREVGEVNDFQVSERYFLVDGNTDRCVCSDYGFLLHLLILVTQ